MPAESDPTYREVCWANGEMREHIGADDVYEPVILSHVYFLLDRMACQIKIGVTDHLGDRVRRLTVERGRPLELLGVLRGGRRLENALHERFQPWRVEPHEWYSSEIAADVLGLLEFDGVSA